MSLKTLKSKITQKKKRVGRGNGSKRGTYSGKGMKGQTARTGGKRRPGFEGGQTPFLRKMPKIKGFKNPNKTKYQVVNIGDLNIFDDNSTITNKELLEKNLICKKNVAIKLLGGKDELKKSLTIKIDKASNSAIEKVKASGGTVELKNADNKTNKKKNEESIKKNKKTKTQKKETDKKTAKVIKKETKDEN